MNKFFALLMVLSVSLVVDASQRSTNQVAGSGRASQPVVTQPTPPTAAINKASAVHEKIKDALNTLYLKASNNNGNNTSSNQGADTKSRSLKIDEGVKRHKVGNYLRAKAAAVHNLEQQIPVLEQQKNQNNNVILLQIAALNAQIDQNNKNFDLQKQHVAERRKSLEIDQERFTEVEKALFPKRK